MQPLAERNIFRSKRTICVGNYVRSDGHFDSQILIRLVVAICHSHSEITRRRANVRPRALGMGSGNDAAVYYACTRYTWKYCFIHWEMCVVFVGATKKLFSRFVYSAQCSFASNINLHNSQKVFSLSSVRFSPSPSSSSPFLSISGMKIHFCWLLFGTNPEPSIVQNSSECHWFRLIFSIAVRAGPELAIVCQFWAGVFTCGECGPKS